jgi:hypothetical protein
VNIKAFFLGMADSLKKAFHIVKAIVPADQLEHGIELVRDAAIKFADNPSRKQFVVTALMGRFGVSESIGNLITEMAVQVVKSEIRREAEKGKQAVEKPA